LSPCPLRRRIKNRAFAAIGPATGRRVVNYFGTTAHIETAHTNTSTATSMMPR
jgi:hypothetical protein